MVLICDNLFRDNKLFMIYRVAIGAFLSSTDVATDMYVIFTYYQSTELISQANILLAMIATNLFVQVSERKNKAAQAPLVPKTTRWGRICSKTNDIAYFH